MKLNMFNERRFRQGSTATAITVVVVAIIVAVNFLATALTDRFSLKVDLTETKVFSITEETKEFLHGLDSDVTIYVLDTEESFLSGGEFYLQANEVLRRFAGESSRIQLQYVDLLRNPGFTQNYPDLQLSSTSILVTSQGRVKDLSPYQLYNIDTYGYVIASQAEQVLTSAILTVISDEKAVVNFITGHGEEALGGFTSLLTANDYVVEEKNLLTEDLSEGCDLAIIVAPQRDYDQDELRKLDRFLENGGNYGTTLMVFPSGMPDTTPNLEEFLADWGIGVSTGIIYETDPGMYHPQSPYMAVAEYSEYEYAAAIIQKQMVVLSAYATPLEVLFDQKGSVSTQVLLNFSETAGLQPLDADENWDPNTAQSGPFPHLVMSSVTAYQGMETVQSHVLVGGTANLLNDDLLSDALLGNAEYFLSLVNQLTGKDAAVIVQEKSLANTPMGITAIQAIVLGLIFTVILPLALLIFGIVIWLSRRHR